MAKLKQRIQVREQHSRSAADYRRASQFGVLPQCRDSLCFNSTALTDHLGILVPSVYALLSLAVCFAQHKV